MTTCKRCHLGRYKEARVPYLAWLNERMIVVPDVAAHVCDVCGLLHYNPQFMAQMQDLIDLHTTSESQTLDIQRQLPLLERFSWERSRRSI